MTPAQVAVGGALAGGVVVVWLCAIGLLRARDVYGRLHYGGPANVFGPAALIVALAIGRGPTASETVRAVMIGVLLVATGPIAAHAAARAAWLRSRGTLDVRPEDAGGPR